MSSSASTADNGSPREEPADDDADTRPSAGSTRVRRRLTGRQRLITLAFFIVGAALHLTRVWDRLSHPGLWAEDASIFYLQDQTRGLGAIFSEYAGYLHLICRIPAAIVGPYGLTAVPAAFAWTGAVVGILSFAVVLSPRLNRIIPSVWGRGIAFLALCCIPAMNENGANVLNLIFVCGIAILLLGLAQQPLTWYGRALEIGALAVLGLSGPLVAFLSPLFLWRWIKQRSIYNLVVCGVVAVTAATQLVVYLQSTREGGGLGSLSQAGRLYLQRVSGEWVVGPYAAVNSWDSNGYIVALSITWLALVVLPALWFLRMRALLALAITMGTTTAAALTYGWIMQHPWSGDRHLVVPMATLIVFAVGAVAHGVRGVRLHTGVRRVVDVLAGLLAAAAVAMSLGGIQSHFWVERYPYIPPRDAMQSFEQCLDQGRQDCQLAISPPGYMMNLNWQ